MASSALIRRLQELFEAYNVLQDVNVMPTNLYELNDNYDLETAHMLPVLLHKAYEAKLRGIRNWWCGDRVHHSAVFCMCMIWPMSVCS